MDVSRLPPRAVAPPASTAFHASTQVVATGNVESTGVRHRDVRPGEGVEGAERAVQGEWLPRERTIPGLSTRAWLDARNLEHALPGERPAGISHQARSAILGYLDNTRPEATADLLRGQSVNAVV